MDPLVQVAIVSGVVAVICAWISRPTVASHRRLKRIEGQFENNGGSSVKDQLDRIERTSTKTADGLSHLTGRFDQHVADVTLARREGIAMWSAVETVAQATPPEGDQQ